MSTLIRVLVLLLCVLLVNAGKAQSQIPSQPQPLVSMLIKDASAVIKPGPRPTYIAELAKLGIIADLSGGTTHQKLTFKQLMKYSVLLMSDYTFVHGQPGYDADELAMLLDRYMQEGGSILYIGTRRMNYVNEHDKTNQWLEKHGAQFRWATIEDPEHSYTNLPESPHQRKGVIYTTNIAKHPLTEGVKTLFFRTQIFRTPYLRPLTVSDDWTVLVRTMPTANIIECTREAPKVTIKTRPETAVQEASPLLAVRQVGKGRLALLGHDPGPFIYNLGQPAIGAICSENGDGIRKPDWLPLLRNLAVWLSEPARQTGVPGSTLAKVDIQFRSDWGTRHPIDWDKPDIAWGDEEINRLFGVHSPAWSIQTWRDMAAGKYKPMRILVGARTQLSGGKGSVEDWKQAALKAGYVGVVFREDILSLTRKQWEDFQDQCRAATDDHFVAFPGQQYKEWEGNQFMRFNWNINWHNKNRLTEDGKAVREQLDFFFDQRTKSGGVGLPANFPMLVKGNPAPWWSYRAYDAFPVAVYQDGERIEDNLAQWEQLIDRIEYVSPMAVHLLDDPVQVARASDEFNLYLLAPDVKHLRTDPTWNLRAVGLGRPNNASTYVSNGPVIEAFLPLAVNRTTLGASGVHGSYQWQLLIRARSEFPIARVEVWAGSEMIRCYRPNSTKVHQVMDEVHDRQRGVWLKIVDSQGREAYTTSTNSHDKMFYLQWCADHCNQLGAGMGVDENGDPSGFGIATHVRLKFSGGTGPGASHDDAKRYIPWGTDTGIPSLGLQATVELHTKQGKMPRKNEDLIPDMRMKHNNRTTWITRQVVNHVARRDIYLGKHATKPYDKKYFCSWGAYFKLEDLKGMQVTHDDLDFHRDANEPAFQWVNGNILFNTSTDLEKSKTWNLELGRSDWLGDIKGWRVNGTILGDYEQVTKTLGKGGYFSFANPLGNGTIFALDDTFTVHRIVRKDGSASCIFYGNNLGAKQYATG
ncbi:MAG TPA: hypothetical protein DCM28_21160, partial [Phycisphaerales bacterium]|nr:hypothetical protein [Phycisphaerales bacterium]